MPKTGVDTLHEWDTTPGCGDAAAPPGDFPAGMPFIEQAEEEHGRSSAYKLWLLHKLALDPCFRQYAWICARHLRLGIPDGGSGRTAITLKIGGPFADEFRTFMEYLRDNYLVPDGAKPEDTEIHRRLARIRERFIRPGVPGRRKPVPPARRKTFRGAPSRIPRGARVLVEEADPQMEMPL